MTYTSDDYINDEARIAAIETILGKAALGRVLLDFAVEFESDVTLDAGMKEAGSFFDTVMGDYEIYLNARLPDEMLVLSYAYQLRHLEQFVTCPFNLYDLSEDDAVRMNRIFEADASAYVTGLAHELYEVSGNPFFVDVLGLWRGSDIVAAFENAVQPTSGRFDMEDPKPFAEAFDQWFKDERRKSGCDKGMRDEFKRVQSFRARYDFDETSMVLDEGDFVSIGDLSVAKNYLRDTGRTAERLLSDEYGL